MSGNATKVNKKQKKLQQTLRQPERGAPYLEWMVGEKWFRSLTCEMMFIIAATVRKTSSKRFPEVNDESLSWLWCKERLVRQNCCCAPLTQTSTRPLWSTVKPHPASPCQHFVLTPFIISTGIRGSQPHRSSVCQRPLGGARACESVRRPRHSLRRRTFFSSALPRTASHLSFRLARSCSMLLSGPSGVMASSRWPLFIISWYSSSFASKAEHNSCETQKREESDASALDNNVRVCAVSREQEYL